MQLNDVIIFDSSSEHKNVGWMDAEQKTIAGAEIISVIQLQRCGGWHLEYSPICIEVSDTWIDESIEIGEHTVEIFL